MDTETDQSADRPGGQSVGSPIPPAGSEAPTVATDDEPLRVPSWMHEPEVQQPIGLGDRVRLAWERAGGGLLLVVSITLAVGLVGLTAWGAVNRWGHYTGPDRPNPTNEVLPTSAVGFRGQTGLFVGTPAESFPEGETGIVLPAVTPQPPFTAKQVSDGLAKVRQALVLGRLDIDMRLGNPEKFIALFAKDAQEGLRADFRSGQFASYATRFGPDARSAIEKPRARGQITYRSTRDENGYRVLEITTKFVWVYPFDVPNMTPGDALVVVGDELVWHIPHPDDVRASSRGLWLATSQSYASNINCGLLDQGLIDVDTLRGFPQPQKGPVPDVDPDAAYDVEKSLTLPDTC
ncbi:hypothetical protein GCM10027290_26270 [Micromonospora sonneratiae]|uniref:Uncharacterized protein n=1 Tax=Micromonospora sonneratiae TaxID=1184706 RepID=A0ABW3YKF4_9ACTN